MSLSKVFVLMFFLVCSVLLVQNSALDNFLDKVHPSFIEPVGISKRFIRQRTTLQKLITDCIHMVSEEGRYIVKAPVTEETCGVYIFTDTKRNIEVSFDRFNIPCESGGLVSFVDGWELNGQYFPSAADHPRPASERFTEFCGYRKATYNFKSSQNVALIQYSLPARLTGFTFTVRFINNPAPCNVLLVNTEDIHTMRNYGKRVNCSMSAFFPATVKILAMSSGVPSISSTGTSSFHKVCSIWNPEDLVQVGCSNDLGNTKMQVVDELCGLNPKSDFYNLDACGIATVRLISSGTYNNFVTVAMKQASAPIDEDVRGKAMEELLDYGEDAGMGIMSPSVF